MSDLTLHTGFMGDQNTIHIDWYNENNVRQKNTLEINIQEQDKPRVLELLLDGHVIAVVYNSEMEMPVSVGNSSKIELSEYERYGIDLAKAYQEAESKRDTATHNQLMLIAKLAKMLDL